MALAMSALVPAGFPAWVAVVIVVIGFVIWMILKERPRTGQGRSSDDQAKTQNVVTGQRRIEQTDIGDTGKPPFAYPNVDGLSIQELKRQGRLDEARDLLEKLIRTDEEEKALSGRNPPMARYRLYKELMIVLRKQKAYAEVVRVLEHMATLTKDAPKYWGEPSKLQGLLDKARADAERHRFTPESDTRGVSPDRKSTQVPRSSDSQCQPIAVNPTPDNRALAKGTSIPTKTVPPFSQAFPSEGAMSQEQLRFFRKWERAWERGTAIDVEGSISYLCCYTYRVLKRPLDQIIPELQRLIEAYSAEDSFLFYCRRWLSDCYVFLGDFHSAINEYPRLPITSRNACMTDNLLSLKLHAGVHISGRDILTLHGPKVTKWGREHLDQVEQYLDVIVKALEKNREVNLLEQWWKGLSRQVYGYSVLNGAHISQAVPCGSFSRNPEVIDFVAKMTREAENAAREESGLPRVGEGWIAETELYYELCRAFSDTEVIHHARPVWLGKQHLDVFIPEYAVAIEYQGEQHDQPVEYFGGLEAFNATRRRDQAKMSLCNANCVRLIYVKEGYDLAEVIREVVAGMKSELEA